MKTTETTRAQLQEFTDKCASASTSLNIDRASTVLCFATDKAIADAVVAAVEPYNVPPDVLLSAVLRECLLDVLAEPRLLRKRVEQLYRDGHAMPPEDQGFRALMLASDAYATALGRLP